MPSGYRAPDALKDEFFSLLRQGVAVKEASARIGVWRNNTKRGWGKPRHADAYRVEGGVEAGPVPAVRPWSSIGLISWIGGDHDPGPRGVKVAAIAREIGRDRSVV